MKIIKPHAIVLLLNLLIWSGSGTARAQGTAITYQGRLMVAGVPANGSYDITFALFTALTGPSQVGDIVTNSSLAVSDGLFLALLDFGTGSFNGADRWLEISVRPAGNGPFTLLTPRQAITPAPYAIFAASAGNGSPWSVNGDDTYYTNGKVGIGTSTPTTALHVKGGSEGIRIDGPGTGAGNLAYLGFGASNGTRIGYVGDGSGADNSVFLASDSGNVVLSTLAGRVLTARTDGRVTIGSAAYYVPGGEENLRIIRGVVSGSGGILVGSGFTVAHGAAGSGQYTVTFNTPFIGAPTVTATADLNGRIVSTAGVLSGSANFQTRDVSSGGVTDAAFHFIAIGAR